MSQLPDVIHIYPDLVIVSALITIILFGNEYQLREAPHYGLLPAPVTSTSPPFSQVPIFSSAPFLEHPESTQE
jgi:hypothetical protein